MSKRAKSNPLAANEIPPRLIAGTDGSIIVAIEEFESHSSSSSKSEVPVEEQ